MKRYKFKPGDQVTYNGLPGTVICRFRQLCGSVSYVVDFGPNPDFKIKRRGFYWDGDTLAIGEYFLKPFRDAKHRK